LLVFGNFRAFLGLEMYCETALKLLQELKRSKWLPPYNDENLRKVVQEIDELQKILAESMRLPNVKHPSITCGILLHYQCILRNKRCALAYLYHRMRKIRELWWQTQLIMPPELKNSIGPTEQKFLEGYDQLMGKYMVDTGLSLTVDQSPPKDLYIEVRALQDYGEILTDTGLIKIEKNSVMLLRRTDVEPLIKAGVLMETSH